MELSDHREQLKKCLDTMIAAHNGVCSLTDLTVLESLIAIIDVVQEMRDDVNRSINLIGRLDQRTRGSTRYR